MALDLSLHDDESDEPTLPPAEFDSAAEDALATAAQAWVAMRAGFDAIDRTRLSPASRETYARMLVRIGLWADARSFGEPIEDEPDEAA